MRSFLLEHSQVKTIFGRKKNCPPKSDPKWWFFRKFKCLDVKYSQRNPPKALSYQERRHLTYFA